MTNCFNLLFTDFSCAFVCDILLQGYLYITKNYIAFYSNVFGYVTKLLIPVTSVAKISKEKTVKIIPNAIAVATIDERHVFSSFLSREAAYQLIISVWKEALPFSDFEVTTTSAQLQNTSTAKNTIQSCNITSDSKLTKNSSDLEKTSSSSTLQVLHQRRRNSNSGISEMDDESSSAMSGSEGSTQLLRSHNPMIGEVVLDNRLNPNNSSSGSGHNNPSTCDFTLVNRDQSSQTELKCLTESLPKKIDSIEELTSHSTTIEFLKYKIPRTIHIVYFGLSLVIILALLAGFLFYCISEVKNIRLIGTETYSIHGLHTVWNA